MSFNAIIVISEVFVALMCKNSLCIHYNDIATL